MSTPIENNTEELQTILQTVNNLPNLGGSGSSDVFIVHVTLDENWENVASIDKTYEEIAEAVNNGKACFAIIDGIVVPLTEYSYDYRSISFSTTNGTTELSVYKEADGDWLLNVDSIVSSPYFLGIGDVLNNGEVSSFTISDADQIEAIGDHFDRGDDFYFRLTLIDSETNSEITHVSTTVKFSYIYDGGYYFARVFVKEGYFDVSVYLEWDSDDNITSIRVELSFTKMT